MSLKLKTFTPILILSLIILGSISPLSMAKTEMGIGGEFLAGLPQLIGSLRIDNLSGKVGVGVLPSSLSFSTDGKFYFFLNEFPLDTYLGGGVLALIAPIHSFAGCYVITGVEFSLSHFGLPITIFGGLNYLVIWELVWGGQGRVLASHIGVIVKL